ncbi:hypothetical protein MUG84_26630 [Paenibacillus sp. KQZ6P-2]|uniref:Uncharacterized protein n=1 Tax=Paenibacillus mangrovi TaxID=2931978 RepID=A0A9X1WUE8_9BACL|nr:hypothetical protein [Paenibacillus mangrovi]MCJ8015249.1 hypothetical protein [Paenibacillus mangrovi]
MNTIPQSIIQSKYLMGTLNLFLKHHKLRRYCSNQYIDVVNETINVSALKRISRPWSKSEKFMLALALHLYNESNKVNLSDMDCLDDVNKRLAFEAIHLRFQ